MRTRPWVPWLYLAPGLLLMAVYLVYPALRNVYISFFGRRSVEFVRLSNYAYIFTDDQMLQTLWNNFLWLTVYVGAVVLLGVTLAVLLDRVPYEKLAKILIFMPMGIQAVGAGIVWKFVYAYAPKSEEQIGLLNAIVTGVGGEPVAWLIDRGINTLMIIVVGIWIWTGFSLVFSSASYKALPNDVREAARIDGANEWQIFWRIIIPMMRIPIMTITFTMIAFALKLFDEIWVMTGGNFGTHILSTRMFQAVKFTDYGRAAAIAVVILLAIIPAIIYNVRLYRQRGVF